MGLIGKILKSVVEDEIRKITTEIYPNYTKESRQVAPPGIDSTPLPDDQGALIIIDNASGKSVQIGVYSNPESLPGEIRIVGRNSSGVEKGIASFKNNGDIIIDTGSADIILKENGDIDINGGSSTMFFKTGGDIEINGDADNMIRFSKLKEVVDEITADITTLKTVFGAGWTVVPLDGGAALKTAATTWFGTPLIKDINDAKIDEVLTS